ncbi:MAG: glutamate--cysteine ligase [Paucimonas sp.]|nr:glutamate--cysteine ligase [Paucimonas sp.]
MNDSLRSVEMATAARPAFTAQGIELELMIVERDTLEPLPIADRLLRTEAGAQASDVQRGLLGWSNELVLHVVEVKNLDPGTPLEQLGPAFQREVRYLNRMLAHFNACLLPTAMHPWMDPRTQTHIWPHDNAALYAAYARIFNCGTHGWSNLQSMHVNLPFSGDDEFARLHAAVRLVLPLLPALAASSPIVDGQAAPALDYRMQAYSRNADEIPSIAGRIIPEPMSSRAEYEQKILAPMYRDIAPHDPQHLLQYEWLNSRGAIARFDRSAIEIRVLDTQENPQADLAIAAAVIGMVKRLYFTGPPLAQQQAMPTSSLAAIFQSCVLQAEAAQIEDERYLSMMGHAGTRCTAGALLQTLVGAAIDAQNMPAAAARCLRTILEQGPLARRILRALDGDFRRERLAGVYRELGACLDQGRMFMGAA